MLFNRLDNLYQRMENPMQQARDMPGCLRVLEEINAELRATLGDIHQAHGQYDEKIRTRQAMQQGMKPAEGTPPRPRWPCTSTTSLVFTAS